MDVTGNISTFEVLAIAVYMAVCLAVMEYLSGRANPTPTNRKRVYRYVAVPPPPANRKRVKP